MPVYVANWDLGAAASEGESESHTAGIWDVYLC